MKEVAETEVSLELLAARVKRELERAADARAADIASDPDLVRAVDLIRARRADARRREGESLESVVKTRLDEEKIHELSRRASVFLEIGIPECATPVARANWSWIAVALGRRRAARGAWMLDRTWWSASMRTLVIDSGGALCTFRFLSRIAIAKYVSLVLLALLLAAQYFTVYGIPADIESSSFTYTSIAVMSLLWLSVGLQGSRAVIGLKHFTPRDAQEARTTLRILEYVLAKVDDVIHGAGLGRDAVTRANSCA